MSHNIIDDINTDRFTLYDIKRENKNEYERQEKVEAHMILLKMQRDLLALSSTIASDQNLKKDQNHRIIKEQVQTLSKFMYSELEYIKLACEYENTPWAQQVREKLLSCEYAKTKYDPNSDYEFWEDKSVYMNGGSLEQLRRLCKIHNSGLSIETSVLFVASLDYQIVRDNNLGKGYLYASRKNLTKRYSNQNLGSAREKFRKSRNDSISKLFNLFSFTTSLHNCLTSGYIPETYDTTFSNPYIIEWNSQEFINKKAKEFQKSLKTGPNASCWNKK